MGTGHTTVAVQHCLDDLAIRCAAENTQGGDVDPSSDPIVRDLIATAVRRLQMLSTSMLMRHYPRLARPPFNVQSDELLSAVVERLIKALRKIQPPTVRQFFALANRHIRWELNDLARRLDHQQVNFELRGSAVAAPPASEGAALSAKAQRILLAIDDLPADEREVFDLIRIQGMTQVEAAQLLSVSPKTIQRRLTRGLLLLAGQLADLAPAELVPADLAPADLAPAELTRDIHSDAR